MTKRLDELVASLPGDVQAVPCDVGDSESVAAAFARIGERHDKLHILVNNAAVYRPCPVEHLSDADIQQQLSTNLVGPVLTCRAAIPLLRAAEGADIVNTSSESTLHPFPMLSMYVATKAGLEAFSQVLAAELQDDDSQSIAATDKKGNIQLLLWDYSRTLPDGVNNQQYFIKDLPPAGKGEVRVQFGGLKAGSYTLTRSHVGYRHNDAYTAYIGMGSPKQLTKAQVATLKSLADGKPEERETVKVAADGRVSIKLPMRENDVYLLELSANR